MHRGSQQNVDMINMSEVQYIIEQQRKSNALTKSAHKSHVDIPTLNSIGRLSTLQKNTSPLKTANVKVPSKKVMVDEDEEFHPKQVTPT